MAVPDYPNRLSYHYSQRVTPSNTTVPHRRFYFQSEISLKFLRV